MTRPAPTNSAFSTSPRAIEERGILFDVVRRTAEACFMPLTVGGGVRTVEDIRKLLLAGADKVSINTAAVQQPGFRRARRRRNSAANASSWRSTPSGCRRQARRIAGRSSPMAGASATGIDAVAFARAGGRSSAPARFCSPRWIATAPRAASTSRSMRAIADAVPRAGHRLRRRRHARPSGRRRPRRPCQRGARRLDLPFRHPHDRRGEGATWRRRGYPSAGSARTRLRCAARQALDVMT